MIGYWGFGLCIQRGPQTFLPFDGQFLEPVLSVQVGRYSVGDLVFG